MAISAYETMKRRKMDEWIDHQQAWLEDPESEANHMVFGFDLSMKQKARQIKGNKSVSTWR